MAKIQQQSKQGDLPETELRKLMEGPLNAHQLEVLSRAHVPTIVSKEIEKAQFIQLMAMFDCEILQLNQQLQQIIESRAQAQALLKSMGEQAKELELKLQDSEDSIALQRELDQLNADINIIQEKINRVDAKINEIDYGIAQADQQLEGFKSKQSFILEQLRHLPRNGILHCMEHFNWEEEADVIEDAQEFLGVAADSEEMSDAKEIWCDNGDDILKHVNEVRGDFELNPCLEQAIENSKQKILDGKEPLEQDQRLVSSEALKNSMRIRDELAIMSAYRKFVHKVEDEEIDFEERIMRDPKTGEKLKNEKGGYVFIPGYRGHDEGPDTLKSSMVLGDHGVEQQQYEFKGEQGKLKTAAKKVMHANHFVHAVQTVKFEHELKKQRKALHELDNLTDEVGKKRNELQTLKSNALESRTMLEDVLSSKKTASKIAQKALNPSKSQRS